MTSPDARTWRLEEVGITGLFGRYNHKFTLDQHERVTILNGPNGVGKTAILRLLYAIFAGRTFQLFATKFAELSLSFDSGETVRIKRAASTEDPTAEHIAVLSSGALGLESSIETIVDAKTLTKFASSIARRVPWLERIDDEVWIDRRTAERLTTGELLSKFDGSDPDLRPARIGIGEQIKPLLKLHGIVQDLSRRVNVHIIETQRLLAKPRRGERRPYRDEDEGDSEVRTTVLECAEELKKRIAASLRLGPEALVITEGVRNLQDCMRTLPPTLAGSVCAVADTDFRAFLPVDPFAGCNDVFFYDEGYLETFVLNSVALRKLLAIHADAARIAYGIAWALDAAPFPDPQPHACRAWG